MFSFLASIYILMLYYLVRHLRRHPNALFASKAMFDIIHVLASFTAMGQSDDSCWCSDTDFGGFIAFVSYGASVASEAYTLCIAIDLILNVQSPFTDFQKNMRRYNIFIFVVAMASAMSMVKTDNHGTSLVGTCGTTYYEDKINGYLVFYFVLVCSATIMQVAALMYVERKFRRRNEIQDLIWQDRDKTIRLSYQYALFYLIYWLVIIVFRSIFFVVIQKDDIGANHEPSRDWSKAIHALAFLEGLRSLPSLLLWSRWGHYLWHKVVTSDDLAADRDDNDSLAPQLNESLRNEMVSYMQVGLSEIVCAEVTDTKDTRVVYIKYAKSQSSTASPSTRRSYAIHTSAALANDAKGACLSCLCPFLASNTGTGAERKSSFRMLSNSAKQDEGKSMWLMKTTDNPNAASCVLKELMASHFNRLRKAYGVDDEYQKSLRNINAGKLTGGRSGSFFFFTSNSRFAIKTMSVDELAVLTSIVTCDPDNKNPSVARENASNGKSSRVASSFTGIDGVNMSSDPIPYVDYILKYKKESMIVKIFGVYELQLSDYGANVKFYVMENIFPPNLRMDEKYDIKGMSGEGAPLCPGPIVHRKSNPPKRGAIEVCRICHKTF
eukprot:g5234.t1